VHPTHTVTTITMSHSNPHSQKKRVSQPLHLAQ
jgi:hypothetical protein